MIPQNVLNLVAPYLAVSDSIALCYLSRSSRFESSMAHNIWIECAKKLGLVVTEDSSAMDRVWSYLHRLKKEALSLGKISEPISLKNTKALIDAISQYDANNIPDEEEPTNFSDKNIQIMPQLDESFSQTVELSFTNNKIKRVVSCINLVNLTSLYLSANRIEKLPNCLFELPLLEGLYVSENEISSIPPSIGSAVQLEELDIGINPIEKLPSEMAMLTRLRDLKLDASLIDSIPRKLLENPELLINDAEVGEELLSRPKRQKLPES